ncbi:MAG: sialidase family protein [Candidatus Saccharimonadales bacterium]
MRTNGSLASATAAAILLVAAGVGRSTDLTVYQLADGIIRPSPLRGAQEAYLPIIRPSNHASNLLALPNGDLLCFWFSGSEEGNADVSIAMSRLNHGSNRWSIPVIVASNPGLSDQNPVPFLGSDGQIFLFHTSQKAEKRIAENTALIYELTSEDQGHTWSRQKVVFSKPGWYDRQHLVTFHHKWLFPLYFQGSAGITTNAQEDWSAVKISTDQGKTWSTCKVPGSGGLVQMDIVKLSPDRLLAFFRSRYADWIYESHSSDGCHWSTPVATQLPNNNSSIQVIRLKDGHLVMAFNNTQATATRGKPTTAGRGVLSVGLSVDEGKTWPWVRDVQAGAVPPPFRPGERFEYSYPSIVQAPDGLLQMSFTFRRETIKYMTFSEDWIKDGHTVGVFKGFNRRNRAPKLKPVLQSNR